MEFVNKKLECLFNDLIEDLSLNRIAISNEINSFVYELIEGKIII